METQELRLGNLVEQGIIRTIGYSNGNSGCHIVKSEYDSSCGDWHNASLIKGIPLTEEWFKRFGFEEYICNDDIEGYLKDGFCWINRGQIRFIHDMMGKYECGVVFKNDNHIQYVHELQNTYFYLTREELQLKY